MWSQVFPKDPDIEESWPRIEELQKERKAYFDNMDEETLRERQEEIQAEIRAEQEQAELQGTTIYVDGPPTIDYEK